VTLGHCRVSLPLYLCAQPACAIRAHLTWAWSGTPHTIPAQQSHSRLRAPTCRRAAASLAAGATADPAGTAASPGAEPAHSCINESSARHFAQEGGRQAGP
jgi:hypothetical protein